VKTQCNRFGSVRLATLLLTLAGGTCFAQFNASIQGIVQDPTGGVVPKATVTLLNEATEVTATAITDTSGIYHFVSLPPGRYRISAVAQGFEKTQVEASLETNELEKRFPGVRAVRDTTVLFYKEHPRLALLLIFLASYLAPGLLMLLWDLLPLLFTGIVSVLMGIIYYFLDLPQLAHLLNPKFLIKMPGEIYRHNHRAFWLLFGIFVYFSWLIWAALK